MTLLACAGYLAVRSVAWPLALAGLPALVIALTGRNPFPQHGVYIVLFGWAVLGIAFEVHRDRVGLSWAVLREPVVISTILLSVWLLVRLPGSSGGAYATQKVELWMTGNLVYVFAGVFIGRHRRSLRLFLGISLAVSAVSALIMTERLAAGSAQAVLGGRYALSSQFNPIEFGRSLARASIVAAFILLLDAPVQLRLAALAVLAPLGVAFFASGSRGPLLGLVIGLIALLAFALREPTRRKRVVAVGVGLVLAGVFVAQLVPGQDLHRALGVLTGASDSSNGRNTLFSEAGTAIGAHPVWGIGTGGFASIDPIAQYPHDIVVEAWAELGVIGFVLVIVFLVAGGVLCWRVWRTAEGGGRLEAGVVAALYLASVPNALVSGDLPNNYFLWTAAGLALGIGQRRRLDAAAVRAGPGDPQGALA